MFKTLNRPFAVVLATVLLLLGLAPLAWADVTQAQCAAEWANSAADDECIDEEISVRASDDYCVINASCVMDNGGTRNDSYAADLDDVSDLVNCNGFIKFEGDCTGD